MAVRVTQAVDELRELRGRDAARWEFLEAPPADDRGSEQRSAATLKALDLPHISEHLERKGRS